MVPATVISPAAPDPVVKVVVPAVLKTIFPVLNERLSPLVVNVGDAAVRRMVLPVAAS